MLAASPARTSRGDRGWHALAQREHGGAYGPSHARAAREHATRDRQPRAGKVKVDQPLAGEGRGEGAVARPVAWETARDGDRSTGDEPLSRKGRGGKSDRRLE